ncbi:MAG: hypothetical protein AAGU75_13365 [Bacillota bacterium]
MKDKEQVLWEEKMLLMQLLKDKPLLLETDLVIQTVCVSYLISDRADSRKFAIIRGCSREEKETLECCGYRTLLIDELHIPTVEFLIEYIFRP